MSRRVCCKRYDSCEACSSVKVISQAKSLPAVGIGGIISRTIQATVGDTAFTQNAFGFTNLGLGAFLP